MSESLGRDEIARPRTGTAAGVPYMALPPTAVGADTEGPVPLIVVWHGFDPPRSESACAAALPMTGVAAWRVHLGLPLFGGRLPAGGLAELAGRDYLVDLLGPAVEGAVAELPAAVAELRTELMAAAGPVGLVGVAEGGTAALLALAEAAVPVAVAALVAPVAVPARMVAAMERRYATSYRWTDAGRAIADRLDCTRRAAEVARNDPPLLLVGGQDDALVTPADLVLLRDSLRAGGAERVESATFRMGHSLAEEPGTQARPPTAEAVSVDAALTDWFRDRLGRNLATGVSRRGCTGA